MDSRNPAFIPCVQHQRRQFVELMHRGDMAHRIYPSKHFFERLVERNLEAVDVLRMLVPIIKDFRETTFNKRSYASKWKHYKLFADITVGPVTGKRQIILKTIYDRDIDESNFDVVVQI